LQLDARTTGQRELKGGDNVQHASSRLFRLRSFPNSVAASEADGVFKAKTAIKLPGGQGINSFDISFVDPVVGLYILGDHTNKAVDVVDTETNTVLGPARQRIVQGRDRQQ
jgi:hypothetical protein